MATIPTLNYLLLPESQQGLESPCGTPLYRLMGESIKSPQLATLKIPALSSGSCGPPLAKGKSLTPSQPPPGHWFYNLLHTP